MTCLALILRETDNLKGITTVFTQPADVVESRSSADSSSTDIVAQIIQAGDLCHESSQERIRVLCKRSAL